jgi:hypothetical protein
VRAVLISALAQPGLLLLAIAPQLLRHIVGALTNADGTAVAKPVPAGSGRFVAELHYDYVDVLRAVLAVPLYAARLGGVAARALQIAAQVGVVHALPAPGRRELAHAMECRDARLLRLLLELAHSSLDDAGHLREQQRRPRPRRARRSPRSRAA